MTPGFAASRSAGRQARALLPSTPELLAQGGDARIALDAQGVNKYGCRPYPDAGLLAFGSSTASVVSAAGFAAADDLRRRLLAAIETEPQAAVYARELARVRRELLQLCCLDKVAGLECLIAASGTDIHLLASQLAGNGQGGLRVVMPEAAETGSGVPAALGGRHFSSHSALGTAVAEGLPVTALDSIEVAAVPLRGGDGALRDASAIDAEIEALVRQAVAAGQRVLLVLTDVSKTGLIAPGIACVDALREKFADEIEVLVDACQFRLAPATLHAYLERGFMVALTGSKFVGGPSFSGALLVPASSARRLRWRPLPQALAAYSSRAEWPANWAAAETLASAANFGLLLRWEAALQELRQFRALPEAEVGAFLRQFARAVQQRLAADPAFEPLDVPALDRGSLSNDGNWDRVQTIFPFLLCHRGQVLDGEQTRQVYRLLQYGHSGLRCQLGQPVNCGVRGGVPVGALRLCLSARLVVEALQGGGQREQVIAAALAVLDRTASIVAELRAG